MSDNKLWFGQEILCSPTEQMHILAPSKYEAERGAFVQITSTANGYQWSAANAMDLDTAKALCAALGDLIFMAENERALDNEVAK